MLQNNLYQSVAIPLRMVEVFTDHKVMKIDDIDSAILEPLSKHGERATLNNGKKKCSYLQH